MIAGTPRFSTNLGGISEKVSIKVGCMFDMILHPEDFINKFTQLLQIKLKNKIALRDRNRHLATLCFVALTDLEKFLRK